MPRTETITNQFTKLSSMKKSFSKILFIMGLAASILCASSAQAAVSEAQQNRTVVVTVTDANGPVIGATVMVAGTTNGDNTGVDGTVTLSNVPASASLEVSFVGYLTQVVPVNNRTAIEVVLVEDAQAIEDVVVVGYGVQKKATLSGAVSAITSEEITQTKTNNLINNVQGKIPGLLIREQSGEPGEFNNMLSIRGYGSPLIIIDGVARGDAADLAQLNSNDIESMSVLKDASAAIYGMGAANGVILVTTKQGQAGRTSVSYSGTASFKTPTAIEPTVDAYTYRLLQNEMNANDKMAPSYDAAILEKYQKGEAGYTDFDWYDLFMRDWTVNQSHNLTVRGGTNNIKFFTSVAFNDDQGLLKSNIGWYKRTNIRNNLTAKLTDNLELQVGSSIRLDDRRQNREEFIWNYKTLLVNERGKGWHTMENENHYSYLAPEGKNLAALIDPDVDGYNETQNRRFENTATLTYKAPFLEGLTASAQVAYDFRTWEKQSLQKSYALYDYYTDAYVSTFGSDWYQSQLTSNWRMYTRGQINYNNKFGDHTVGATLVAEMDHTHNNWVTGTRNYAMFTNPILDQGDASTATNGGNWEDTKTAAYIGRLNYDYAGKYMIEAMVRYDGSYRYAPGKRWAMFPSVSAAWRLSEESFIKDNTSAIDNLKIRASYGETGQNTGNAYAWIAGYGNSGSYTFDGTSVTTGMNSTQIVSDRLTWVTSQTLNLGLDFDLWGGKLGGSIDAFQRTNVGSLASRVQVIPDDLLGASFSQENLDSSRNFGFELALTHRNNVSSDFSYSVTANFTYARSMNLHVESDAVRNTSYSKWTSSTTNRYNGRNRMYYEQGQYQNWEQIQEGALVSTSVGNSWILPGSIMLKDLDGNGLLDGSDRDMKHWAVGSNPPYQFGLNFTANYKSFDFSVLFQGAAGHSIQWKIDDIWGYGRYPATYEKYLDRWHVANVGDDPYDPATKWVKGYWPALRNYDTYIGGKTKDSQNTARQIVPGTYVRLKNVEVGYTLPKNVSDAIGIQGGRVFVSAYNLFTICNPLLKGADPERIEGAWNAGLTYPLMRTISVGVNVNF